MDRRTILLTSFYHLKSDTKITLTQEKQLWAMGVHSWDDLLHMQVEIAQRQILPRWKLKKIVQAIKISKNKHQERDINYFMARYPAWDFPRLLDDFQRFAYFGIKHIEGQICTIILFDGNHIHTYIQGVNLESFAKDANKYDALACISGKADQQQKSLAFGLGVDWSQTVFLDFSYQLHFKDNSDVYKSGNYPEYLKRENYSRPCYEPVQGGQIHKKLTKGLWIAHKQGQLNALPTLLAINAQEVVHLSSVFIFLVNQQIQRRQIPYKPYTSSQIEQRKLSNLNLLQNYFHSDWELIARILSS